MARPRLIIQVQDSEGCLVSGASFDGDFFYDAQEQIQSRITAAGYTMLRDDYPFPDDAERNVNCMAELDTWLVTLNPVCAS